MSNKKIVFQGAGGVTLVGGLEWQLLPASKKADAAVREKAKIKSASHFAICQARDSEEIQVGKKTKGIRRSTAGLIQILGAKDGIGKKAHSLAATFAAWTGEVAKAALFAVLEDERVAVVVSINGMPVFDSIIPEKNEARMRLSTFLSDHSDMQVFSNDAEQYPQDFYDGIFEALVEVANTATSIKAVPIDFVSIGLVFGALICLGVGWQYWKGVQEQKKQKALVIQAQKTNPDILYQQALASVTDYGIERDSLLKSFSNLRALPVSVKGWVTKEVDCLSVGCTLKMDRTHGTFDSLRSGIAHLPVKISHDPSSINLTSVIISMAQELKQAGLPESARTATVDDFVSKEGSKFQDWMLAGLSLKIDAPSIYPQVAGVPSTYSNPNVVRRGAFEVSGVSLPLVNDVVRAAPSNVVFTGYQIAFSTEGDDDLSKANATIKGFYYVNQ